MKLLLLAAIVTLSLAAARTFAADADKPAPAAGAAKGGALYHVVSFKFKETATPEQVKAVVDAFAALPSKIPAIASYAAGTNVSPEKHDKGFTHCFVLTFASDKDRDDYLVHPDHKAFGKIVGPVLADVFVVDFWSGAPGK